jgi:hypothetical protein
MKHNQIIKMAFGTKLTVHQLNQAIRLGALLLGGEISFRGKPGADDRLTITCSELTSPFVAEYGFNSVEFHFAEPDRHMLACIREVLDDGLIYEMSANLEVQARADSPSLDRVSA